MQVLIAFDKFKNCLSAAGACELAGRALARRHPDWQIGLCPLSDGGEGFGRILTRSGCGTWAVAQVAGPRGELVAAGFGIVLAGSIPSAARALLPVSLGDADGVAIIEMAEASGLALLPMDRRDPWQGDTRGTGELMRSAAEAGARVILLGVGGSATNDLGLGALAELGVEPIDAAGERVDPVTPAQWERICGFRGGLPGGFPPVFIACDVANPLLGPQGCSAVYGPQKGLLPGDVQRMEFGAARIAHLLANDFGQPESLAAEPGTGAAGGISFGLRCAAQAQIIPGAEFVAAWLDLDRHLSACDILLTGEGRFDATSLKGKGPGDVVRRAASAGKKVFIFAGSAEAGLPLPPGVTVVPISPSDLPLEEALARGGEFLARAVAQVDFSPFMR